MRPLPLLFAVFLVAAPGCATLPEPAPSGASPGERTIAWIKEAPGAPFRDQHDVCHVYARDDRTALNALGAQIKACFERTLPRRQVEPTEVKSVRVAWKKLPPERVREAYTATVERAGALLATNAMRGTKPPLVTVRGFYTHVGAVCHVVVPDRAGYAGTLGHEFKHCLDGDFHDHYGNWLAPRAREIASSN